jgi:hypothetical protein
MNRTFHLTKMPAVASLVLLLALAGTTGPAAGQSTNTNAAVRALPEKPPVVGVKDFLHDPHAYAGRQIILEGFVTDVCRRKGCWALLHDNDADADGQIRVQQNEEGDTFKAFLPELQGKSILVTGKVKETRIDSSYLDKWEGDVKAAKEKKAAQAGKPNSGDDPAYDDILKKIIGLRERVAKSKHGFVSSYSVAVNQWEPQAEKP